MVEYHHGYQWSIIMTPIIIIIILLTWMNSSGSLSRPPLIIFITSLSLHTHSHTHTHTHTVPTYLPARLWVTRWALSMCDARKTLSCAKPWPPTSSSKLEDLAWDQIPLSIRQEGTKRCGRQVGVMQCIGCDVLYAGMVTMVYSGVLFYAMVCVLAC